MKNTSRLLILAPLLALATASADPVSLFNGKDLTGWHTDVPAADKNKDIEPSFIVRDGKLVSLGVPKGHLITDKEFENYKLVVEYRFAFVVIPLVLLSRTYYRARFGLNYPGPSASPDASAQGSTPPPR